MMLIIVICERMRSKDKRPDTKIVVMAYTVTLPLLLSPHFTPSWPLATRPPTFIPW